MKLYTLLCFYFLTLIAPSATAAPQSPEVPTKSESYLVAKGDSLSKILHRRGVSNELLWGKKGWIAKNQKLNPHVKDWKQLEPGTRITLEYPDFGKAGKKEDAELAKVAESAPQIAETEREIPALNRLLLLTRIGSGTAPKDKPLLPKLKTISLEAWLVKSQTNRFGLLIDVIPKAEDEFDGQKIFFRRHSGFLAWNVGIRPNSILDGISVTPKIGMIAMRGRIPRDLTGGGHAYDEARLQNEPAVGMAADMTASLTEYTSWRLWAEYETGGKSLKSSAGMSNTVNRYGVDLHFPALAAAIGSDATEPGFLLFVKMEQQKFTGNSGLTGNVDEKVNGEVSTVYAGLGLSLSM